MREQFNASGGKAVKRGEANMLQVVKGYSTRARAKSRFFDRPYNPRMLTQERVSRTNSGKAEAKPEPGRANTLVNVRESSPWPLGGLAAMGRMLGQLRKAFQLASPVWVRGAKRMGAIHSLWPMPAVTGVRACVRGRQLRRVTVRCQLLDGVGMAPATLRSKNSRQSPR
jgi:hypothetical protein